MEQFKNAMAGNSWADAVIRTICFNGGWFGAYDDCLKCWCPVVYVSRRFMDSHKYVINQIHLVSFMPWENC